ncbi:uncharacterized protein LOC125722465 [Brienomyrus brachyistius]|uniref:uncharacterized protein LOC125722465 n=1 Tax=Brienomyrus brachyistius TaxID=42636 RepID=UPI0020B213D7|nr:uncharacterized protein LOC125722465 [Brienomyrus brachyistius]
MMLWAAKDTGRVEAVVGPNKLYDHSFRTLQGNEWLSDEVIDAYVHYILEKQQKPIHQMCAVVATSLFTGKFRTLMKMKFPVVEKWACPVNVGAHWILVVVDIPLKKIILMDPFGNEASYERRILRNWRNFMKQRGDDESRATWTVATLQHNKQRDGSSCGVFILKLPPSPAATDLPPPLERYFFRPKRLANKGASVVRDVIPWTRETPD